MRPSGEEQPNSRLRGSEKISRGRLTAIAASVAVVGCLGVIFGVDRQFVTGNYIAHGVSIVERPVGGLSRSDALKALTGEFALPQVVRLESGSHGRPMNLPAKSVGLTYDLKKSVDMAMLIGRTGSIVARIQERSAVKNNGRNIALRAAYNKKAYQWVLQNAAAERFATKPNDASITIVDGQIIRKPGNAGTAIDIDSTLKLAEDFEIDKPVLTVTLPVILKESAPKVTMADLEPISTVLATYTTHYNSGQRNRTTNVRLAADAANGVLLKPGEEFSYNKKVGPRVKADGYRDAIIFVNGKMEPGTGGGICQVSSTIYNAALLSGLKINQRRNHSLSVVYVPAGRDATVSYGAVDLKFENPFKNSIYITSKASGGRMTATIYGAAEDRKNIKVVTQIHSSIPYTTETVVNPRMAAGKRRLVEKGVYGRSVTVKRIIEHNGETKAEVVSRDRYRPHPAVYEVGPSRTKPMPEKPSQPATTADSNGAPGA